jgi:hypothetical protein
MSFGEKKTPFKTWLVFEPIYTLLLWEHGCSLGSNLSPFFPQKNDYSLSQFKIVPPQNMIFFEEIVLGQLTLKKLLKGNLFSSILFMDENKNSGEGSNLGPLDYKGILTITLGFFL